MNKKPVNEWTNSELRRFIAQSHPKYKDFQWDDNFRILGDTVFPIYLPNWPEDVAMALNDLAKIEFIRHISWLDIFEEWCVTTFDWDGYKNESLSRLLSELFVLSIRRDDDK